MLVSRRHESVSSYRCPSQVGRYLITFMDSHSILHPHAVARLVSDVLTRNRDDPVFEISVLPCSITYM